MKLRVRALESQQTIGIDIPDDSSFHHLKHSIAQAIRFPSPSSLRLSLNRTHHISPSSPDDSLLSLGITAGDLLFYSVVDDGASTSAQQQPIPTNSGSGESEEQENGVLVLDQEAKVDESFFAKRLVRALSENLGENDIQQKWIIGAVHSIFLESGFVSLSGEKLRFPSPMGFTMPLHYSLPEIISAARERPPEIKSAVVLKFQTMKSFVNVYGHLTKPGPSPTFRICLDSLRFAPARPTAGAGEGLLERELWKIVRDRLVLPLNIHLHSWAGLAGPACCLAWLPVELVRRILEFLPSRDVAMAECVCRELRRLARDNGLWGRKFREEFGVDAAAGRCKSEFVEQWKERRREAEDQLRKLRNRIRRSEMQQGPHPVWLPAFWVLMVPVVVPTIGVPWLPSRGGRMRRDPPHGRFGGRGR